MKVRAAKEERMTAAGARVRRRGRKSEAIAGILEWRLKIGRIGEGWRWRWRAAAVGGCEMNESQKAEVLAQPVRASDDGVRPDRDSSRNCGAAGPRDGLSANWSDIGNMMPMIYHQ